MKCVNKGHCNGWILSNGEKAIKYQINLSGVIVLDEMLYKWPNWICLDFDAW